MRGRDLAVAAPISVVVDNKTILIFLLILICNISQRRTGGGCRSRSGSGSGTRGEEELEEDALFVSIPNDLCCCIHEAVSSIHTCI